MSKEYKISRHDLLEKISELLCLLIELEDADLYPITGKKHDKLQHPELGSITRFREDITDLIQDIPLLKIDPKGENEL